MELTRKKIAEIRRKIDAINFVFSKKRFLDAMREHQKAMKKCKSIFGKKYPGLFGSF